MRRPTLFLAVPLLVACGSAGGSDPADGSGGAAGSTGAGGGGGSAMALPKRPDPGPPPKSASGVLSFTSMQGNDGALKNALGGIFLTPAKDLSLPDQQMVFTYYASIPVDTCTVPPSFTVMNGSMPMAVDAGTIELTLPSGTKGTISKMTFGPIVSYNQPLPADAFVPSGAYQISASGGGVPAFTGTFYAPGDVTIAKPALPLSDPANLPLDAPLDVAWTGTPDGSDVIIEIKQPGTLLVCRVMDDGAFTIPVSALAYLKASGSGGAGADPDQLIVEKYTWYTAGQVLLEAHSGMTLNVAFQ
jgi:hypothetical protein